MGKLPSYRADKPNVPRREVSVIGVHRTHCCRRHGCKYGNDLCPVVLGDVLQAHACEVCEDDIAENWDAYEAANDAYDAGRRAGQLEGYQHGFSEGSFRGFRQGRRYAETGKLEPMGTLPYPIAHEATDEMVAAFGKAWERADAAAMPRGSGVRRRAGLEAVLALLRRDAAYGEETRDRG